MGVDASFAEFVSARWSTLFRLAALLVGEDRADELTQAALVRAYLVWPEVREPAPTDDLVKAMLADTAVTGPYAAAVTRAVEDVVPGGPVDRPAMWASIGRLLPRQRAVLVLRHYELLSDAEIAHALGCSATTVAADALALETGVDVAALRDELVLRAHEADVPPPPLASVLSQGRRARRRRTRRGLGWATATAAVVIAGLAVADLVQSAVSNGSDPSRSGPAAEIAPFVAQLPRGDPPRIAYSVGRTLHVNSDREVVLGGRPTAIVQTRHWLFITYLSGQIVRVDAETGELVTFTASSGGEVATDPSGNHVAWLVSAEGPAVVSVQSVDAASVAVSDRQTFPATPRCCDNPFVVNGITKDGDVVASLPAANQAWVWTTPDGGSDTDVREISGLGNGVVSQVMAGGIAVQYPPSHFAAGVLEGDVFLVHDEINARQADFGDPLGRRVVYADTAGEIHVRERGQRGRSRRGSQDIRLQLPAFDEGFNSARWEDDGHVLLDVADASTPAGALVRCDVGSGACEIALRFGGPHLVAR